MARHAYLIMAYDDYKQLKKLLPLLDDKRNDIFVYIDKKTNVPNCERDKILNSCKYSTVYMVDNNIKVYWAGPSEVYEELDLFKYAYMKNKKYAYYHLLSAKDLPLQSQDYIHNYFDSKEKEYLDFFSESHFQKIKADTRVQHFHLFPELSIRTFNNKFAKFIIRFYRKIEQEIQLFFKVNLWKNNNYVIGYGSNWCSLSGRFVSNIVKKDKQLRKDFRYSIFGDEFLIQTIFLSFKDAHYEVSKEGALRKIDWSDGTMGGPHVWRKNDFEKLKKAKKEGYMFARKFDSNIDNEIIDKWVEYLSKN